MKYKKKKKSLIGWVYIIVVTIVILFFMKEVAVFGMRKLSTFILPIQSKIYVSTQETRESFNTLLKYKDFFYENRELKKRVIAEEHKDEVIEKLSAENDRLRKLLNLKGKLGYKTRAVRVSFQHVQDTYEGFIINVGSKDGMEANMPVLSGRELIGRITKVDENYSFVKMITSENNYVSCLCNNVLGIVSGQRDNELYFKPTSSLDEDLEIGTEVKTSGISDVYPKGLYVGKISEIISSDDNLEKKYKIKIETNIYDFQEALVLVGDA